MAQATSHVDRPRHRAARHQLAGLDRRGVVVGLVLVVVVLALVYVGSEGLRWFDAALAGYLMGTLLAVFAVAYRYVVWVERPPTRTLRARGWQAFWGGGRRLRNVARLPDVLWRHLVGQGFIARRSVSRWFAHQCLFWGCVLAALVTFPLTFGWLHFESVGQDDRLYQAYVAGWGTVEFESRSFVGFLMFHALDVAAVLVLVGVLIFLVRRLRDPGALAVERSNDLLALAGLFAVSVTGLMLTVSSLWLDGRLYTFISTVHAATVILGLLYIPFGKLFHIFQRPGTVGLAYTARPPSRRGHDADHLARHPARGVAARRADDRGGAHGDAGVRDQPSRRARLPPVGTGRDGYRWFALLMARTDDLANTTVS